MHGGGGQWSVTHMNTHVASQSGVLLATEYRATVHSTDTPCYGALPCYVKVPYDIFTRYIHLSVYKSAGAPQITPLGFCNKMVGWLAQNPRVYLCGHIYSAKGGPVS